MTQTIGVHLYSQGNPTQKSITESIIKDIVISCNMPLSLTDKPSLKNFMNQESKIKYQLKNTKTVTANIKIKILGVTSHFMEM